MVIGMDYRPAYGRGGLGVYVRELLAALARAFPDERYALYGHRWRRPAGDEVGEVPARARLHRRRWPAPLLATAARLGLGADRLLGGVDVLHLTDFAPLRTSRAPVVASLHDVLFEDLPDCYPGGTLRALRRATRRIVAQADHLLVPCAQTAEALTLHYGVGGERLHVVPLAPRSLPAAAPAREHGRYILSVGTLQPRKNLLRLFEAFDALRPAHPDLKLVVVGGRGWLDDEILAGMGRRPHVVYEGVVAPARLHALYQGARVLAYPALAEGFGLPVLEALAAGTPVVVARGTVCADVAGEGGIAVDATDPGALADGLRRLVEDEGEHVSRARAGSVRAAEFTWERTARATHAVYERAARR